VEWVEEEEEEEEVERGVLLVVPPVATKPRCAMAVVPQGIYSGTARTISEFGQETQSLSFLGVFWKTPVHH
jgi:hypothetical protein